MSRPRLALSIQQPWADLILHHGKDVENRTWPPGRLVIGEPIYVHAGIRRDTSGAWREILPEIPIEIERRDPARHGAILGEVTVVDCVTSSDSPWFFGPYGWVLANPVPYVQPTPHRGRLGLFVPRGEILRRTDDRH